MTCKQYVKIGDRVRVRIPHSEVCMHMLVAGKFMDVEVVPSMNLRGEANYLFPMAQLYDDNGRKFSFPVTLGEAGILRDESNRLYVVKHEMAS